MNTSTDALNAVPLWLNRLRMRQLALLLAVGERGTLREAANRLGMTQPAATKMIHELETTLGHALFERAGRRLRLTDAGHCVLGYFRGIRGTMESLSRELAEIELGGAGQLSVGCIMAPSPTLLTRAVVQLKQAYPLLSVHITVDTSDHLLDLLRQGELDVAVGRLREPHRQDYQFSALENEALSIVVGIQHPLAKRRVVRFADLLKYAWILQPPGSPMRQVIEQEFRDQHTALPNGLIETASILTTTDLLSETHMVGVLPSSIAQRYQQHRLVSIVPYRMAHQMESFGSITRKDRPVSRAAAYFLAALHEATNVDTSANS